ncbi:MAG TPA: molybdopterin-guanine dinucleotide biosynthesis protein B [Bacillota bacterium]|jgi:molybdopterin-guanine dinucleotide biosynthesis protein B|nr:molybdopterin-guanine dinucleotide biosynthesis protein B [Peptococcaceae bacterium MAG4]NLW37266.1 molybdopterin-guanine dinucleotide biosynthesis protein B [Peptococcaceae bacterium]HQD76954.1 molybdopterin-guanine dinucleotide biosynthesis protein B [Bacillota bacterium]HUM59444.1 molybdopterin-guanine dinucleotide biosynthesis protein B [Bacillota bacterium]
MKVFSVFGVSLSGKTTTIEHIIAELKRRGYRVGSVKNIHFEQFTLDMEGSNTWRHKQAGSELVVARGLRETGILFPQKLGMDKILSYFDHDYVVVEGVADTVLPKILCASEPGEIESRLNDLVFLISGRISNQLTEYKHVPVLNPLREIEKLVDVIEEKVTEKMPSVQGVDHCNACGSNCRDFVVGTLRGERRREECVYVKDKVSLFIGQQEVKVNSSFVAGLRGLLDGLVTQLENYNPVDEIKITIGKK